MVMPAATTSIVPVLTASISASKSISRTTTSRPNSSPIAFIRSISNPVTSPISRYSKGRNPAEVPTTKAPFSSFLQPTKTEPNSTTSTTNTATNFFMAFLLNKYTKNVYKYTYYRLLVFARTSANSANHSSNSKCRRLKDFYIWNLLQTLSTYYNFSTFRRAMLLA